MYDIVPLVLVRDLKYSQLIVILTFHLTRLHVVSEDYHHSLCKKKEAEALEESHKLLPVDALGVVMIKHGEEFGDDSAFGWLFSVLNPMVDAKVGYVLNMIRPLGDF